MILTYSLRTLLLLGKYSKKQNENFWWNFPLGVGPPPPLLMELISIPFLPQFFSLIGLRALNHLDSRILDTSSTFQVGELCGEGEEAARGGGRDRQHSSHFWDVSTYIFSKQLDFLCHHWGCDAPSLIIFQNVKNSLLPSHFEWSGVVDLLVQLVVFVSCQYLASLTFAILPGASPRSSRSNCNMALRLMAGGQNMKKRRWKSDSVRLFIYLQWPLFPIIFCFSHFLFSPSSPSFKMT